MLLFLAATAIRGTDPEDASRWLQELDTLYPDVPERISLRWEFMEQLRLRGEFSAYTQQASLLLPDRLFLAEQQFGATRSLLRGLYEDAGPAACEQVLISASSDVRASEPFCSTLALCRCPKSFQSRDEANEWSSQVDSDSLSFSPVMAAEAALIAARTAEWAGDWETMAAFAREATVLTPEDFSGRYWLLRAHLHGAALAPTEAAMPAETTDFPNWRRLVRLLELHTAPSLAPARAASVIFSGEFGFPDVLERELTLQLLERALTSGAARTPAALAECAELSASLSQLAGALPWMEINLALKEIQLDGEYSAAACRLERIATPEAEELFRLARIFMGAPIVGGEFVPGDSLSAVEWALQRVTARTQSLPSGPGDAKILEVIEAARSSVWAQQFPVMLAVIDALKLTVETVREIRVANSSRCGTLPPRSPIWVGWLLQRIQQVSPNGHENAGVRSELSASDFASAWCRDAWWYYYGTSLPALPEAVQQAQALIESEIARLPNELLRGLRVILAFRQRTQAVSAIDQPRFSTLSEFVTLGRAFDVLIASEMELELKFAQARTSLTGGRPEVAVREFQQLCDYLDTCGALTVAWWRPLLRYWLGVAGARASQPQAESLLAELVNGRKGSEARAQIALLAIGRNDLTSAESWLEKQVPVFPSLLYARALLAERRGDNQLASELLKSFTTRFAASSPYRGASDRLRAAIAERQGRADEAAALNEQVLQQNPSDAVATLRLMRMRLMEAYSDAGNLESTSSVARFFDPTSHSLDHISWSSSYRFLYRMLTCSNADLSELQQHIASISNPGDAGYAWRQLLARRFLAARRATEASTLYECESQMKPPTWFRRTRGLLKDWNLLSQISRDTNSDTLSKQLESCAAELAACADTSDDAVAQRWSFLLSKARVLVTGQDVAAHFAPWKELSPWPFAGVPALWAASSSERLQAAELLLPALDNRESSWTDRQRQVLYGLAHWVGTNGDAFLTDYAALEPELDSLPVSGSAVWLAAASVWFRKRDWKQILESELPACVADLSLPQVRLTIGLAYAQAALEDINKSDNRAALQRITQARSTLLETAVA